MNKNMNKKSFTSVITGAVLLILVIGVTGIIITQNSDNFDLFNKKINETINYSLSNKLNVSQFNLEERKDALKIFLATEFLSNPNSQYINNIFVDYKLDSCDTDYTNCYKIDDTTISCNESECFVTNFNLKDELDNFKEKYNVNNGQFELEDCDKYDDDYLKYSCENTNLAISEYLNTQGNSDNDAEKLYKDTYSLPTRYVAYSTLPENEINNLQTAFNQKVTFWKTISNIGFVVLSSIDVLDLGGYVVKFAAKNYNPKFITNLGRKLSSFAVIDANSGNKVTKILKNFVPDIFKYDSTIKVAGKKISVAFLDDDAIDLYKRSKQLIKDTDSYDEFFTEFKKLNKIDVDNSNIKSKIEKYYNSLKSNTNNYMNNLEYQLSFELTLNKPRISIAKTIFSTALYDLFRKTDDTKTIKLLQTFTNSLKKYVKYSNIQNIIKNNIDEIDNIYKKILSNSNDFTSSEIGLITEISKEIGLEISSDATPIINRIVKNSVFKDIFLENYDMVTKNKNLLDTNLFTFKNPEYEKIFAESAQYLSEYIGDGILDENVMQLLIENSFIKISRETLKNTNIKKTIKTAIDNLDLNEFTDSSKNALKITTKDEAIKFTTDEEIIIKLANNQKYKISGQNFYDLNKNQHSDPKKMINVLLANTYGAPIDSSSDIINLKEISFNIKSNIDLTKKIDPIKKTELIQELNKNFPLVNTNNIDNVFDEIYEIKNNKKTIDNILNHEELSVIQNEKIFTNIMNDIEFNENLIKYIEIEEQFESQYEKIFNSISSKKESELILGLSRASDNINIENIPQLYSKTFEDSRDFTNMFFGKFNPDTYSVFKKAGLKEKFIKNFAKSTKEVVTMSVCYPLFLNVLQDGIFDYDIIDLNNEINNEKNEYKTNIEQTYEKFSQEEKKLFENFFKNTDDILEGPEALAFASFCFTESSFAIKKGLFRSLMNYLQLENAYYLPNEISSIDTISLYNSDNYYSFDQLEYFSALELSNFESYILRLEKDKNEENPNESWYEPFYLISPCNTDLIFTKSSANCKYDVYDYIYNNYTLSGDTANLKCNKISFIDDEGLYEEDNLDFLSDESNQIIDNYEKIYAKLKKINELDPEIIKDFLFILLDRNLKYTYFHFLQKDIKNNEDINPHQTYLNVIKDFSTNVFNLNNIISNDNTYNNNFVQLTQNKEYFNTNKTKIEIITRINYSKNFLPFLISYNEYHIPSFILINLNNKNSTIREYNHINNFYKIENFIPIIVKINNENFIEGISDINLQNPDSFNLTESELNDFLNNYNNGNFKNIYNNYYVFDIIYDKNNDFNYEEYMNYLNFFVKPMEYTTSRIKEPPNSIFLNFGNFEEKKIYNHITYSLNSYKYPTLLETTLYLDGFDNSVINKIYELNDGKFEDIQIEKILEVIYNNNLYDLLNKYITENEPYYYDCSDIEYNILKQSRIIKECKLDGEKSLSNDVKTIDVSLTNTNEESYCYYYKDDFQMAYEKNSVKWGLIMSIPGVIGGIAGPTPLGIGLQLIDVAYSLYDLKMMNDLENDNKWPNSGLTS